MNMKLNAMKNVSFLSLIATLLLAAPFCVFASSGSTGTGSTLPAATATNTYENSEFGVSVQYPSGWTYLETEVTLGVNLVRFVSPESAAQLEQNVAYPPMLALRMMTIPAGADFQDFIDAGFERIEMDGIQILSSNMSATLDGKPGYEVLLLAPDQTKIREFRTNIGDKVIGVVQSAPESEFDALTPMAEQFFKSVRITAPNEPVEVISNATYVNSIGTFHVIGEVQNMAANETRDFVNIIANFYDEAGTLIGTESTYADISQLSPGARSTFDIFASNDEMAARVADYNLTVTSDPLSEFLWDAKPVALSLEISEANIDESSYEGGTDYLHVVGEVENRGLATASFVQVVAAFYNSNGDIVAVERAYTEPTDIPAGQKAAFDITLSSSSDGTQELDLEELANMINGNANNATQWFNVDSNQYSSIQTEERRNDIASAGDMNTTSPPQTTGNNDEDLTQSDGDLTATINGNHFTTGEEITITGSIEDYDSLDSVAITMFGPEGDQFEGTFAEVQEDGSFEWSFLAGMKNKPAYAVNENIMETDGTYTVILNYVGNVLNDDEPVEMKFEFTYEDTG